MAGLVFDTSTERGIVAIGNDQKILFVAELPAGLQSAQSLLPILDEGLRTHNIEITQIEFIGAGIGPGSYTGIRVGAAAAKTLAFGWDIPLIGICTLDAFLPDNEGDFAVVIDAKIGGVYLQISRWTKGVMKRLVEPMVCSVEEAASRLHHLECIVTPNAQRIQQKLEAFSQGKQWKWEEKYPSAIRILQIAQERHRQKNYDPDLPLMYMRKTQAEIERQALLHKPKFGS